MLIVAHHDHIIRDDPLFLPVIKLVGGRRNIVIHRQDQALLPAGNGKLPQKLDIVNACFFFNSFKVHIQPVQVVRRRVRDQAVDQLPPRRCGRKKDFRLNLIAEIIQKRPYLKSHFMRLFHILPIRQRTIIPLIIRQGKPGGRDHVQPLRRGNHLLQLSVGFRRRYLMPAKDNLFLQSRALINRLCEIPGKFYDGRFLQTAVFNITDTAVLRRDPGPLLHRFQHRHRLPFGHVGKDWTLDPAQLPNRAVPLYFCRLSRAPVCDKNPLHLCRIKSRDLYIRIIRHKPQSQIDLVFLQKQQRRTAGAHRGKIGIYDLIRQRINQKLFSLVPVKPLVDMLIDPGNREIAFPILIKSLCLLELIVIKKGDLIALHIPYLRKIRRFLRRRISLNKSNSHGSQDDNRDQSQRRQHRYCFSHWFSLSFPAPDICFYASITQMPDARDLSCSLHTRTLYHTGRAVFVNFL